MMAVYRQKYNIRGVWHRRMWFIVVFSFGCFPSFLWVMIGWGVNLNSVALMTNLILCIRFRIAHICYHYISMGLPIIQVSMSTVLGTIYLSHFQDDFTWSLKSFTVLFYCRSYCRCSDLTWFLWMMRILTLDHLHPVHHGVAPLHEAAGLLLHRQPENEYLFVFYWLKTCSFIPVPIGCIWVLSV